MAIEKAGISTRLRVCIRMSFEEKGRGERGEKKEESRERGRGKGGGEGMQI